MNVADVMTKRPLTCTREDSMSRAAQLMWEGDCGAVVVVDHEGKPTGMITDRDICMAAYTQGQPIHSLNVSCAASNVARTVRGDESVENAESAMRHWQLRRLPVVDVKGELIGILSLNDLARRATKPGIGKTNGLTAVGIAQTLSAVSEPRTQMVRSPLSLAAS